MAHYKSSDAPVGWHPKKGEWIEGKYRKENVKAKFERTARVRTGAVLAFCMTSSGKRIGLVEIKPVEA